MSTEILYVSNNGMICCLKHGGSYLQSEYQHSPGRSQYVTPLDLWEHVDDDYVAEWVEAVGTAPRCEVCR
ncbi:MAG TPA: hypothetical protein VIG24_15230 [Acidimicrobiia bacterium]